MTGWLSSPCTLPAEIIERQNWNSITVDLQHNGIDEDFY
jgi:2-keto-3-deoxy-L-rhamnonate aldolase RhmA